MKKRFYYFFAINFLTINTINAQVLEQPIKLNSEIEFSTSNFNFNNSSIAYSKICTDDLWIRIGLINISGKYRKLEPGIMTSFPSSETQFSCGLLLGIDRHKLISDKLDFVFGLNIQMTYKYQNLHIDNPNLPTNSREINDKTTKPGIGGLVGFYYKLNNNFLIGADLNPAISYVYEKVYDYSAIPNKNYGFDLSLSNLNPMLTIRCRY